MSDTVYILDEDLLASNNKRFLNYILDHIFFMFILVLVGFFLGIVVALFQSTAVSVWIDSLGNWGWNIIMLIISIAYYTLLRACQEEH